MFGAVASSQELLAALGPPTSDAAAVLNGKPPAPPSVKKVVTIQSAKPYPYELPIGGTALVMIDFQRDFMEEGGFGAALGNDVSLLQVKVGGAFWLGTGV